MTFSDLNLHADLAEGLSAMGFKEPTPIQVQAIPIILKNQDLIACAQTGTGKTAAYLLPILHKITHQSKHSHINTLIIAPTRELAVQIDQQLEGFAYFTPVSSLAVYGGGGGEEFIRQKRALTQGADVIIATPGKLLSHLNLGYVKFENLQHLILDEADRMLDMGFFEDIMKIVSYLPKKRQTLLFSATMPAKIRQLSKKMLHEPEAISLAISKPAEGILQAAYMVYDKQKTALVSHLIKGKDLQHILIFSATKRNVKEIARTLKKLNFNVAEIHSDLDQQEREDVLRKFKSKKIQLLVATDILSRGIDIKGINLIINYDVPHDAEDYIHRIGRTARADSTGVALTFINEKEQRKFSRIEDLLGKPVNKLLIPPEIGEGPAYTPNKKSFHRKKSSNSRYKSNKNSSKRRSGQSKGKGSQDNSTKRRK